MRRLSQWIACLVAAICVCLGGAAGAQSADAARKAILAADTVDTDAAEAWAAAVIGEMEGVVSLESIGPGALLVTTTSDQEITFFLDNMVGRLNQSRDDRAAVLEDYLASFRETFAPPDASGPTADQLMPVIRHRDYLAAFDSLPDVGGGPPPEPVYRVLAGDALVMLAVDTPMSIQIATTDVLETLGLDEDAAFARALVNLAAFAEAAEWHEGDDMLMIALDGNYESSLLLLDGVVEEAEARLGGEAVVIAPARDVLVFTRRDRAETIAWMRESAADIASAPYGVTSDVLVRGPDGWRVLKP